MSALDTQEGGSHYKDLNIQPVEYIHANRIPFIEGCIIKYASRWREKGGIADLRKIIHFAELLIELEEKKKHQVITTEHLIKNGFMTPIEKPWYPDDSWDWVEVPPGFSKPRQLDDDENIYILLEAERENRDYYACPINAKHANFKEAVAYKVVK